MIKLEIHFKPTSFSTFSQLNPGKAWCFGIKPEWKASNNMIGKPRVGDNKHND